MNRATAGLGLGVVLILGGAFFAATVPAKKGADVELRAAWGAYAGCMVGGPIPDGVEPHDHLRRIVVSLGPTDDSWTPERWPEVCADERNALQKKARKAGAKEFLDLPYDRASVLAGYGLDGAWNGAKARGFVAASSPKAPRPPAMVSDRQFRYFGGGFSHEATTDDGAIFRWLPNQGPRSLCRFGAQCVEFLDHPASWTSVPTNDKTHLALFDGSALQIDGKPVPLPKGAREIVGLHVDGERFDAILRRGSSNDLALVRDLKSRTPATFAVQALEWAELVGTYLVGSDGLNLLAWSLAGVGNLGERIVLRYGTASRPHLSCQGTIASGLLVQSTASTTEEDEEEGLTDEAIIAMPNAIRFFATPLGIPKAIGCVPWGIRVAKSYEPVETGEIPKTSTDVFSCTLATGSCVKDQTLESLGHLRAIGFADTEVVAVTSTMKYGVHLSRLTQTGVLVDVALTENESVLEGRRVHVFGDGTKTHVVAGNDLLVFALSVPKASGLPEAIPVR